MGGEAGNCEAPLADQPGIRFPLPQPHPRSDTIIVRESPLMQEYVDTQLPGTMLNAGSASGLGHGMGVALGAKLAAADRLVIGTEGMAPICLTLTSLAIMPLRSTCRFSG